MVEKSEVKHWRVLAVDDDRDSLEVIRFTLAFHGADVVTASGGQKAKELLESLRPTIIFLDLSMPEVSGWELLKHIRGIRELEKTPVVALTAHAMKGDQEQGLSAGFDYYMTKPFSPVTFLDELLGMISANGHATLLTRNEKQASG